MSRDQGTGNGHVKASGVGGSATPTAPGVVQHVDSGILDVLAQHAGTPYEVQLGLLGTQFMEM